MPEYPAVTGCRFAAMCWQLHFYAGSSCNRCCVPGVRHQAPAAEALLQVYMLQDTDKYVHWQDGQIRLSQKQHNLVHCGPLCYSEAQVRIPVGV